MNTQKLNKKTSLMILVVLVLTLAFSLVTTQKASASSQVVTYKDGTVCQWSLENSIWYAYCIQPMTTSTGNIFVYNGSLKTPYFWAGQYDANYAYYYGASGWAFGIERATGYLICPSGNQWVYSNTSCNSGANNYAIVGGNTINSPVTVTIGGSTVNLTDYSEINAIIQDANSRIIDRALQPNCASSYYGCP